MNTVVEDFRSARKAYSLAESALAKRAAQYVDAHPELDETGEWKRMSGLFGANHVRSWSFEVEGDTATFEKTTQRGFYDHVITVNLSDLTD